MQHPAALLARRRECPGALALRGFQHVVVAACILAIPPAAFQSFGTGNDAQSVPTQRHRTRQQPCRARRQYRHDGKPAIVATPTPFRARIACRCYPVDRFIAQTSAQAFAWHLDPKKGVAYPQRQYDEFVKTGRVTWPTQNGPVIWENAA